MPEVFISIGSNIEPEKNIKEAKLELEKIFKCKFSKNYFYPAQGFKGKDFTNLVGFFSTKIEVIKLKKILKDIEKKIGRDSSQAGFSDRTIDIDIILYGDLVIELKEMTLPSPEIKSCLYVLEPLVEMAGNRKHPVTRETYSDILDNRNEAK
tara:strand:- start:1720 stop:2175 length:456 start_codon:yes stop_codon:yes gene_type:complete